jgi:hypothetical protein
MPPPAVVASPPSQPVRGGGRGGLALLLEPLEHDQRASPLHLGLVERIMGSPQAHVNVPRDRRKVGEANLPVGYRAMRT